MWAQLASTVIGIWLMVAPAVLGYGPPAATVDRVIGPLVATFALIAAWEATRGMRWLNLVAAIGLMLAPALLAYERVAAFNNVATGAALALLSSIQGRRLHSFAGGWRSLIRKHRAVPGTQS